ncbi:hypothetical protein OS493_033514 [Desmophyllum pertusum]|uniref:Uncharacterized protein n=1 Tax=Desmophyllum pertusum TaxID=174260 RepID=A0A9X0CX31_9CNID|nr:hypothetical protein OS493_033514 [Desmophyllum pertusum]
MFAKFRKLVIISRYYLRTQPLYSLVVVPGFQAVILISILLCHILNHTTMVHMVDHTVGTLEADQCQVLCKPHPGMMPGPMMPPRIPTPPPVQPMPMSRSHTPSPETVLPVASSSNTEEVKGGETQDKTMSQQGTQTIQAKRRTSRTSSRRSSEDKTEAAQEEEETRCKG